VPTDNEEFDVQPTEVRRAGDGDAPEEFFWQGQVHRVRSVIAHDAPQDVRRPASGDAGREEVWRVKASAGRHNYPGVFDLRFDWTAGRWTVIRVMTEGEQ
jgi:hypothetical protein